MDIEKVRSRFIKHFDGKTGNIYMSPGRINLIGEHTDYNGGFVFPGAVDKGIMAEIRPNGTNTVMLYSIDLKDRVEFKVDDPEGPRASWARYIYGICQEMKALGVDVKGFNAAFYGDVPLGAGMSSSAALESCFAFALNDLFGDNKVSKWDLVLAGQATEHKYIGVNCGIMDQFASVFGKEGKLMRLDCNSREFEYFPFEPKGYKLCLVNSKVKHELAGSPYNDRRNSCENVVKHIAAKHPEAKFETLRDCTWEQLEEVRAEVGEEDYSRAHFVLGEKDRVLAVCDALESCFAFALNDLFGDNKVSKWDLALAGQATEHKYIGVNCGIMDQFASVFGKEGKLMRLDCNSREFEYFPFEPKGYKLCLVNSKVKHELAGSPYNDRRNSCENVVKHIAAKHPEAKFETLRDCTWEQLEEVRAEVGEEDYSRAHFVLGEKDRVLAVCDALEKGDYETVGQKMYETHYGLSKEYEVSCEELDFLNDVAKEDGVTGSRIMGGGFGGCTINLVKDDLYDKFCEDVTAKFTAKYGHAPEIYPVVISEGSHKVC